MFDHGKTQRSTFVHRMNKYKKRMVYTILEYDPLLDSSNMTTDDWGKIGTDIEVCVNKDRNLSPRRKVLGSNLPVGIIEQSASPSSAH